VVKKGDILISSDILIGLEGEEQRTEQTTAEGAVTARIWQTLAEEQPLHIDEMRYSGVEKENHSIVISEKEVDIIHPDGAGKWEKTVLTEQPLQLGDFRMPLCLKKEIWKEYEILEKTRTIDETKSILAENLRKKAENLLTPYGKIEESKIYFFGRVYVIPFENLGKFNVYGKKHPSLSFKKEMVNRTYCNELPSKIKKYFENFEVYYKDEKPENIQSVLEKLYYLKLQAKGPVSMFVRKSHIVLCINNSHYYQEVETKNPIDESLVKDYRKDVSMVLSFINSLVKE
jgi:hypothetical protein